MRRRIRPRHGRYVSVGARNSAIKTPAHVYYFIWYPNRRDLNASIITDVYVNRLTYRALPRGTSIIYACVDFNSHATLFLFSFLPLSLFLPGYRARLIVRAHDSCIYIYIYLSPGPGENYPRPVVTSCRYARHESRSGESVFRALRLESEIAPPPINRSAANARSAPNGSLKRSARAYRDTLALHSR